MCLTLGWNVENPEVKLVAETDWRLARAHAHAHAHTQTQMHTLSESLRLS